MIRILIVDDHAIVRLGLLHLFERYSDMEVVAEHSNGADALEWLRHNDCDVALLDISMPGMNGIDSLRQIREEKPKVPVLIMSTHSESQYAVRLIRAGAAGYLTKGDAPSIVVDAICQVANGKKYISPVVAEMLATEISGQYGKLPHEILSEREFQIFLMLSGAKTVAEIASNLGLSGKTVSTYRSRILEKMNLRNNAEMMRYAIEKQISG